MYCSFRKHTYTVKPLNNELVGTSEIVHNTEVFFIWMYLIERFHCTCTCTCTYRNVTVHYGHSKKIKIKEICFFIKFCSMLRQYTYNYAHVHMYMYTDSIKTQCIHVQYISNCTVLDSCFSFSDLTLVCCI